MISFCILSLLTLVWVLSIPHSHVYAKKFYRQVKSPWEGYRKVSNIKMKFKTSLIRFFSHAKIRWDASHIDWTFYMRKLVAFLDKQGALFTSGINYKLYYFWLDLAANSKSNIYVMQITRLVGPLCLSSNIAKPKYAIMVQAQKYLAI